MKLLKLEETYKLSWIYIACFQICSYMNLIPWRTLGHRKIRDSNRPWIEGYNMLYLCKSRRYSKTRSMRTHDICVGKLMLDIIQNMAYFYISYGCFGFFGYYNSYSSLKSKINHGKKITGVLFVGFFFLLFDNTGLWILKENLIGKYFVRKKKILLDTGEKIIANCNCI